MRVVKPSVALLRRDPRGKRTPDPMQRRPPPVGAIPVTTRTSSWMPWPIRRRPGCDGLRSCGRDRPANRRSEWEWRAGAFSSRTCSRHDTWMAVLTSRGFEVPIGDPQTGMSASDVPRLIFGKPLALDDGQPVQTAFGNAGPETRNTNLLFRTLALWRIPQLVPPNLQPARGHLSQSPGASSTTPRRPESVEESRFEADRWCIQCVR